MKKVTLHPAERNNYKRFYDMADGVYEIRNEDGTQIGLLFLSFYVDNSIFIEWMELMSCFRYNGYLRYIFTELHRMFPDNVIQLQCDEEKENKFTGIGCTVIGYDECTELNILEYDANNTMKSDKHKRTGYDVLLSDYIEEALNKYSADNIDIIKDEESGYINIMYHSSNNSFAVFADICKADDIDMSVIEHISNKYGIGYSN